MTPCSGSCQAGLSDRPGPIPELSLSPDNLVLHSSALSWLTASRGVPSVFHYSQTHGGIKSTARGSSFPPLFFSTVTDATCQESCYNRLPIGRASFLAGQEPSEKVAKQGVQ